MKRFVGVDWGSETHAACVVDETGAVLDVFEVGHDPGGIGELVRRGVGEGELTDVTFVELTRFRGHPQIFERGCSHGA